MLESPDRVVDGLVVVNPWSFCLSIVSNHIINVIKWQMLLTGTMAHSISGCAINTSD